MPATFTVLNFLVDDIDAAVDRLTEAGVALRAVRGRDRDGREGHRPRSGRRPGDRMVQGSGREHPLGAPAVGVAELAIRLRGVVKRYGEITAVDGLDLDVPVGHVRRPARPERRRQVDDDAAADRAGDPRRGRARAARLLAAGGVETGAGTARRDAAARQPGRHAHRRAEPARLLAPLPDPPGGAARRDPAGARDGQAGRAAWSARRRALRRDAAAAPDRPRARAPTTGSCSSTSRPSASTRRCGRSSGR